MRYRQRCLVVGLCVTFVPIGVISAAPVSADCIDAGGATVCAQGTVSGGGPDAPVAGPVVPYPCDYDWYCGDGGLDIVINPGPPIDIGRPGRPGGGGGIGPR